MRWAAATTATAATPFTDLHDELLAGRLGRSLSVVELLLELLDVPFTLQASLESRLHTLTLTRTSFCWAVCSSYSHSSYLVSNSSIAHMQSLTKCSASIRSELSCSLRSVSESSFCATAS